MIMYRKEKVSRVLLSPRGAIAFALVETETTLEQFVQLRRDPDPEKPPTSLIKDLLSAGLSCSLDSGLPVPDLRRSDRLFKVWWRHHCTSVLAMDPTADSNQLGLARAATAALYDAVQESLS